MLEALAAEPSCKDLLSFYLLSIAVKLFTSHLSEHFQLLSL